MLLFFFFLLLNVILFHCVPGDARLAKNVKNKVFSFDLVSADPSVIVCDMSNVCTFLSNTFKDFIIIC